MLNIIRLELKKRWVSAISAAGSIPVFVYHFCPLKNDISVLYVQIYVALILSFIAGITWVIALLRHAICGLIWSIFLSLAPLVLLMLKHFYSLADITVWMAMLVLLWSSLLYDFSIRKLVAIPYFFCFRRAGTIFLSIAILLQLL